MIQAITKKPFLAFLSGARPTLSIWEINTVTSSGNGCAAARRTGWRIGTSDALSSDFVVCRREGSKGKPANWAKCQNHDI